MFKKKLGAILQRASVICGITGFTLSEILKKFCGNSLQGLIIGIIITAIVAGVVGFACDKIYQKQLSKKDADLAEKNAELERKDLELEEKDVQIKELNEQCEVWKNILRSRTPIQAGYYMSNKHVYDSFKTNLEILICNLDVDLMKDSKNESDYHLRFKWTLTVLNPTDKPVEKAKFIYSGDKNDTSHPRVMFNGEPLTVSMKKDINVTGDDRFIEINLPKPMKRNILAEIGIDYTLSEYKFNPNYDYIWLVPDALGFAAMSEFHIRFFSDGIIVKKATYGVLKSYILSGNYNEDADEEVRFKEFDGGKAGFECIKSGVEELRGHGFRLILMNREGVLPNLPDYL